MCPAGSGCHECAIKQFYGTQGTKTTSAGSRCQEDFAKEQLEVSHSTVRLFREGGGSSGQGRGGLGPGGECILYSLPAYKAQHGSP